MQKPLYFLVWQEAGEAAKFHTPAFKGSAIRDSATVENTPSGTAEIIVIELLGRVCPYLCRPFFKFTKATSFVADCETRQEIDTIAGKSCLQT